MKKNNNELISRGLLIKKLEKAKIRKDVSEKLKKYTTEYVIFKTGDFPKLSFSDTEYVNYGDILELNSEFYDKLTNSTFSESVVLREMNSQVLDQETFEQLDRILASEDTQAHKLASNIMTNCDYDKSYVYLGELLRRHNYNIKSTGIGHTVAFRALKQYLDYNYASDSSQLYLMIENLEERGLFTEENAELVRQFMLQATNGDLEGENYRIKDIEFDQEVKDKIIRKQELV